MTTRPLTDGEVKLAQSVFGASIDYAAVRVSDQKGVFFHPHHTAMVIGNTLHARDCYEPDYSACDAYRRSLFIHEMTHVWQGQNKVLNVIASAVKLQLKHKFNYAKSYYFTLEEGRDLTSYGLEQQAAIVEEYYLISQGGRPGYRRHCENRCGDAELRALYEKVLEKFIKNPSYARSRKLPPPPQNGGPNP